MNFTIVQRCIVSQCRSNINFNFYRKIGTLISRNETIKQTPIIKINLQFSHNNFLHTSVNRYEAKQSSVTKVINKNTSSLQLKKRPLKRKALSHKEENIQSWNITALATSEEYDLEGLSQGLIEQKLYIQDKLSTSASSKYIQCFISSELGYLSKYLKCILFVHI